MNLIISLCLCVLCDLSVFWIFCSMVDSDLFAARGNDHDALPSDRIAFACSFARGDSIGAAPGAAQEMFDALYPNIPAQNVFKNRLFGAAETGTGASRSADGTMVFYQKVAVALLLLLPGCHIAFLIPNFR
jgi:hypothetical protein